MISTEFKVKIQAEDKAQAKQILRALLAIKKVISPKDLFAFSKAIEKNPSLVKKAKMFL